MSILDLTTQLEAALNGARTATPGRMRTTRVRFGLSVGVRLQEEVTALAERLDRGWAWLEANKEDPVYLEREDRWLTWLTQYERACDALSAAKRDLLVA